MIKEQKDVDFSIVTIVNDLEKYTGFCQSLNSQKNIKYELLPIYNLDGAYQSARKAYNSILDSCNGKYIIFTHPDIRLEETETLFSVKEYAERIETLGVIGVAGATFDEGNINKRIIYSNILHGKDKNPAGIQIERPEKVQTVDECFFLIQREFILKNKFAQVDGWHLYAVELCLQYILQDRINYVIPVKMWHMSDGKSLDVNYVYQLERLIKIYGEFFPIFYTTVKIWKTKGMLSKIYRKYYIIKQKLKKRIMG